MKKIKTLIPSIPKRVEVVRMHTRLREGKVEVVRTHLRKK